MVKNGWKELVYTGNRSIVSLWNAPEEWPKWFLLPLSPYPAEMKAHPGLRKENPPHNAPFHVSHIITAPKSFEPSKYKRVFEGLPMQKGLNV